MRVDHHLHRAWAVPALGSLVLSATMIGRSTLGRDELATWQFVHLSTPDLVRAVGHVDGVLAPYYLLLHLWTSVGDGVVWMRLPSALAVAAAVGVTARIGQRAWGDWAGILAGTALALHPVVAAEAVQARPYAGALLMCTIGTAMVLAPGPLNRRRYVLVMALAVALHLFALAVVVAHLLIVRRRSFVLPVVALSVIALPLALVAHSQRLQVAYLPQPSPSLTFDLTRAVAIPGNYLWIAAAAVAVIFVSVVLGHVRDHLGSALGAGLALILVPPALLYLASHLFSPVLNVRYLITAPLGVALIVGSVAVLVRRPWWLPGVLVAAVIAAALPGIRAVHAPHIKGADFPGLARVLALRAVPGDGLEVAIRRSQGGLPAGVAHYTGDDAFLHDVLAGLSSGEPLRYRREFTGPGTTVAGSGLRPTIWLVAVERTQPALDAVAELRASGCRIVDHQRLGDLALYEARCPVG